MLKFGPEIQTVRRRQVGLVLRAGTSRRESQGESGAPKLGLQFTFLRGNYQVLRRGVSLLFCDTGVIFVNKPGEKGCESALGLLLSGPLCSG